MPSNLLPIVEYLKPIGNHLNQIRLIVTGGEKLHNTTKDSVRSCIGDSSLIFRSTYQTADTGTIGFQCGSCADDEYHLHEELQYVELVNVEGLPHVTVTNLDRYLMPVVRMLTGDVGEWVDGKCACGRNTKKIRLLGRVDANVKIGGEKLQLSILEEWVTAHSLPMERTSITIDKNHLGQDQIGLRVHSDLNSAHIQGLVAWLYHKARKLKAQIDAGIVSPVVVTAIEEIDIKYSKSGKKILVNDRRGDKSCIN